MSGMVAQKIALAQPKKIKSLIGINPIPPSGSPKSKELMTFLEEASLSSEDNALECIHVLTNRKYSDYIIKKMANTWHSCSTSEARMAYLHMFAKTNFSHLAKGLKTPMLLIFGEHGFESEEEHLQKNFLNLYPNALLSFCKNTGHFPMQESPTHLASLITEFLHKHKEK